MRVIEICNSYVYELSYLCIFFHVVLSAGNSYNLNCCIVCAKTLMNRILLIILYLLLYYVVVFSFSYIIIFVIMLYSNDSTAGREKDKREQRRTE